MSRRILALAAAALLAAAAGCGSKAKGTIPAEVGPPIGDDSPGKAGGKKGQKSDPKGESATDG